jgi:hypothetical protein
MANAGVGRSTIEGAFDAGRSAAEAALAGAGGKPGAVIVYATVLYDHHQLLAGVRSVVGDVPMVGCSTQGISRPGGVDEVDRVVGVAVLSVPGMVVRTAQTSGVGIDAYGAGRRLAEQVGPDDGCPLLVWYDPLTGANVDQLLAGLADGGRVNVVGGGAGQPWGPMYRTYQYFGTEVANDTAIAMHLGGSVEMMLDLTHGTEPIGLELEITESIGNLITRIDGQPALQVWKEQLGGNVSKNIDDSATWALGVQLPPGEGSYEGPITRGVFGFQPEQQALVMQVPIPTGTRVQLCHRTPGAVRDRAVSMARRFHARLEGRVPLFALAFECAARPRPFLGDEAATEEIVAMQAILGKDVPWLGHYAWGEIAPVGRSSRFHNYTFPLALLLHRAPGGS